MLKKLKSFLFPEFDELQKQVDAYNKLVIDLVTQLRPLEADIKHINKYVSGELQQDLRRLDKLDELFKDYQVNIKSIEILRQGQLQLQEEVDVLPSLVENIQTRLLGLETKYQDHKDFKPVPSAPGSFRSLRQRLERGAYEKARNSSTT